MANSANPVVEYASIAAVQEAAGFQVLLPQGVSEHVKAIYLIGGRVVDLKLSNDLVYRMAKGTEDISGDWTYHPEVNTVIVGRYTVTERGIYGRVFTADWTNGEFTFALRTPYGIRDESLREMIESMEPADTKAPSPIVKYDYIFEAEYAAGFGILVPASLHNQENFKGVWVIGGKVAEVEYANGIIYRTARGVDDISGVYQKFEHSEAFTVGKYHVLAKGRPDCYYLTLWNNGKMSFSLYCPHGINKKEVERFIDSLVLIN